MALYFVRAGTSLTIVGRKQETLDASRDSILRERHSAQLLTFPADVRDVKKAEEAVAATVAHFGRLDILVANAGMIRPVFQPMASEDPTTWWETIEVNIRGTYNFVHFAIPELQKTKGQIVIHALLRLTELISIEYPDLKVFSIHPGVVATELTAPYEEVVNRNQDPPALSAATTLYLISGKADYLNGRFVDSTWDLGEVERDWKEKIVSQGALVSKLDIPQ